MKAKHPWQMSRGPFYFRPALDPGNQSGLELRTVHNYELYLVPVPGTYKTLLIGSGF